MSLLENLKILKKKNSPITKSVCKRCLFESRYPKTQDGRSASLKVQVNYTEKYQLEALIHKIEIFKGLSSAPQLKMFLEDDPLVQQCKMVEMPS